MTKVMEIRNAAGDLSVSERAELVAFLLGSLEGTHYGVEDEEVQRRRAELDSGGVQGLNEAEFRNACGRD